MNVVVSLEHRFEQTADGVVWTRTQFPRSYWEPYLRVFDQVRVVARVLPTDRPPDDGRRADGEGVSFAPIPYFIGPWQYLRRRRAVRQAVRAAAQPGDAVIMRVPSTLGANLEPKLRAEKRPYAVEVVGDPYDVFSPGASRHPLAPFFRWYFPRLLRRTCARAMRAAYVTQAALQKRYPCPQGMVGFSDVEIHDHALAEAPRSIDPQQRKFRAIHVGTLAQLYKAPDVLIDAVAACRRSGLDLELVLIGDGQYRPMLTRQAQRLGIAEQIRFRGLVTAGEAVRQELDGADVFVLPSHQEGLPRALVEAMARGLPCIGSTVGGIPELLAAEDLVPPGNVSALAAKLREVCAQPQRREHMAARNLSIARTFHADRLAAVRHEFYQSIRAATEAWLKHK